MQFRRMWEAQGMGVFDSEIDRLSTMDPLKHFFGLGHRNAFIVLKERKVETYYEVSHMEKEAEHGLAFFK